MESEFECYGKEQEFPEDILKYMDLTKEEAEAIWNETHYKVSMGTEILEIEDDNTCLIEIQVLPEGSKLEDEASWEGVKESGPGTGIAEPILHSKRKEVTTMHWLEIYLVAMVSIAIYGLYQYWTKHRR